MSLLSHNNIDILPLIENTITIYFSLYRADGWMDWKRLLPFFIVSTFCYLLYLSKEDHFNITTGFNTIVSFRYKTIALFQPLRKNYYHITRPVVSTFHLSAHTAQLEVIFFPVLFC